MEIIIRRPEKCYKTAPVVVNESLAGKSYSESSHQWFTAEVEGYFEWTSGNIYPRLCYPVFLLIT